MTQLDYSVRKNIDPREIQQMIVPMKRAFFLPNIA
jgi:hypothetical protein